MKEKENMKENKKKKNMKTMKKRPFWLKPFLSSIALLLRAVSVFLWISSSARIVMPNSRPRGVTTAGVAPCLARPSPTVWSVAASWCPAARASCGVRFEASASHVSSCEPDASSFRGRFEGGQDRAVHGSPRPRRHNRVEVSAGGPRQGPS